MKLVSSVLLFAFLASPVSSLITRQSKSNAVSARNAPVLPIGEGAYQSAEAVQQRTVDTRKHCEDSKTHDPETWKDCYESGGDYADGRLVAATHHAHSMAPPRYAESAA